MGTAYVAGAFGLIGALLGGLVAGAISLRVAREARTAAESAWIRDNRREIYDRFLTQAQKLLIACEDLKQGPHDQARQNIRVAADADFWAVYGVVQTVAERGVVDAARVYAYRLQELERILDAKSQLGMKRFDRVTKLVRFARHDTIDEMRRELGLSDSARPGEDFNPFNGTDLHAHWTAADAVP